MPLSAALTKASAAGTIKSLVVRGCGPRTALVPEWRNWQTRQVQDLVLAREWRFESSFGHQIFGRLRTSPASEGGLYKTSGLLTINLSLFLEAAHA